MLCLADGSVSWPPVWAILADNNRSCMVRMPHNRPAIENRSVDAAATNTDLALALLLAAGLEGIEKSPTPAVRDAATCGRTAQAAAGCPPRSSRSSAPSSRTNSCAGLPGRGSFATIIR